MATRTRGSGDVIEILLSVSCHASHACRHNTTECIFPLLTSFNYFLDKNKWSLPEHLPSQPSSFLVYFMVRLPSSSISTLLLCPSSFGSESLTNPFSSLWSSFGKKMDRCDGRQTSRNSTAFLNQANRRRGRNRASNDWGVNDTHYSRVACFLRFSRTAP